MEREDVLARVEGSQKRRISRLSSVGRRGSGLEDESVRELSRTASIEKMEGGGREMEEGGGDVGGGSILMTKGGELGSVG